MKIGTVTGAVQAARQISDLEGLTFLTVDTGTESLVAADRVGAGIGDRVLLVTGAMAAQMWMASPTDAAIVAVLER